MRIPLFILAFFAIDFALVTSYFIDYLLGNPIWIMTRFLDLDRESSLPTWYSSVQWFSVAALLAIFARHNFRRSQFKSWLLIMLPGVFLAFSLDEIAMLHERIGMAIDSISRRDTHFPVTGIWMFVIGVPFIILFGVIILVIRTYFRRAPNAFNKIVLGMGIMLAGALGVETLSNFVEPDSVDRILLIMAEEFCEMLGGTIVLWGSYESLRSEDMVQLSPISRHE